MTELLRDTLLTVLMWAVTAWKLYVGAFIVGYALTAGSAWYLRRIRRDGDGNTHNNHTEKAN